MRPDARWLDEGWGHEVSGIDELVRAISRVGTLQSGTRVSA